MHVCSITGIPFYDNREAIIIPVLIKQTYSDYTKFLMGNENIMPLPIAVSGSFSDDEFFIKDKVRGKVMMQMLSSIIGYKLSWSDFEGLRGEEKEVDFESKKYITGFFACHKSVYESIMRDFKCRPYFSNKEVNFNEFSIDLEKDLCELKNKFPESKMSVRDSMGAKWSGYIVPEDFKEDYIKYFAEIQFIQKFLSSIGHQWTLSGLAPYKEDAELALKIFKDNLKSL